MGNFTYSVHQLDSVQTSTTFLVEFDVLRYHVNFINKNHMITPSYPHSPVTSTFLPTWYSRTHAIPNCNLSTNSHCEASRNASTVIVHPLDRLSLF